MNISKNTVGTFHYTLTDNSGNILDTSSGRDPLSYIHGIGNLIPGMEEGLEGKTAGQKFSVKISPEKGYGNIEADRIQKVSRTQFEDQDLQVGMRFRTQAGISTITHIENDTVTLDANHPLAGVELNFDVEITDVREATKDELAHGHVHGPGGHHH